MKDAAQTKADGDSRARPPPSPETVAFCAAAQVSRQVSDPTPEQLEQHASDLLDALSP